MMLWLRSIVFNVAFYVTLILICFIALPTFLMSYRAVIAMARLWARISLLLLDVICGIKVEFRHLDRIPKGALLVASKHQSLWETFALLIVLDDPVYILKRELMWIPMFGWFAAKARMVPVDRGKGARALVAMTRRAKEELAHGRQIIIFPEGTRRAAGAEPRYKYGVAHLYESFGVPCLPMALNSGVFWPRRSLLRYPGTVVVEALPVIPPGLDRDVFFARLQQETETATAALVDEGLKEKGANASA
ncbi:MAG: lysophospholipid acyltransferase family protein [Pseudolabrys sp.]